MKDSCFIFLWSLQRFVLSLQNRTDCFSFPQHRPAAGLRERAELSNPSSLELCDLCLGAFSADPSPFPIHTTPSRAVPRFTIPPQSGLWGEAFLSRPGGTWRSAASGALGLLPSGAAEAQGRCVSHWLHGCCCKGGDERQTVGNSRGYCKPPQGSMNRASRRQLIHAVLWSMQ